MSADDSIEIEFPSLKQSAPQLVEAVESKRAPGPIEAQLTSSSGDDDLSWLSAIFADDEDDEVDEYDEYGEDGGDAEVDAGPGDPASSDTPDDAPPGHARGEPPMVPDGPTDDLLADLADGSADVFEDELVEDDDHDTSPPPVRLYADDDIEGAAPDEPEPLVDSDPPLVITDPDPIEPGTDSNGPQPSSPSKKVTGFREEIMSTFSQMYD